MEKSEEEDFAGEGEVRRGNDRGTLSRWREREREGGAGLSVLYRHKTAAAQLSFVS